MFPTIKLRPVNQMISKAGHSLPLRSTQLRASARCGVASVLLTQLFENPYDEVLSVTYCLPLPADAAVSGFAFVLRDRRVTGEVDRKAKARERYQRAIREGQSAALLEQERSSLFTQEVGNIPPKESITVEVLLDQRLLWSPEGAWEWRFPTTIAPRYQGAQALPYEPRPASLSCALIIEEPLSQHGAAASPSHDITTQTLHQKTQATLTQEAQKDRDLVVRWPVSTKEVSASLVTCRPEIGGLDHFAFGLLTLVPPASKMQSVPRDLILLLDVSGSMQGQPLAQMKEVSKALIETLSARDQLEIIAFSGSARSWRKSAVATSEDEKADALRWINALQAAGGTEMKAGVIAALATLRPDAQRQVILMTDGLIAFEHEIIEEIYARLPRGSRVHTLGIGSAVNRSLTAPVARAGAGVEQIVGLNESAEVAAQRLVVRTASPLVVGLSLGGSALLEACPSRLPDLYERSPALLSLKLRPEGGELIVQGETAEGPWNRVIQVAPLPPGEGEQAIGALYAREAVEDLEMSLAAGKPRREINRQIEDLGVAFQISTRLTSWVAISQEVTVDATAPKRSEELPQELPAGMSARLRAARASLRARPKREESAPQSTTSRRNLALLGQIDAGVTTLTERILYQADLAAYGAEPYSDHPFMDWMEVERERGISIQHKVTSCEWGAHDLNLINLPYCSSTFGAECLQQALEGVILVLCAVEAAAPMLLHQMRSMRAPCVVFINKLDRPGSDYQRASAQLQERLGRKPLHLQIPIGAKEGLEGFIDLVQRRACYFDGASGSMREALIPAGLAEEARLGRQKLIEALADVDDAITEAFLAGTEVPDAQLKAAIRGACLAQKAAPVFLGSALRQKGVQLLIEGIIEYLPSPQEVAREAIELRTQQRVALTASADKPLIGRVFALEESCWGRLCLRIYQGSLARGDLLTNSTTQKKTRASRLVKIYANERRELDEASVGDIVMVSGLSGALGDTFSHGEALYAMTPALPEALLSLTLTSQDKTAQAKLEKALERFTSEDPTLRARRDGATLQRIIAGTDDLQLEIICERLRREYRWEGVIGALQVECIEGAAPLMELEVIAPMRLQAALLVQLSQRRAKITSMTFEEPHVSFTAELPMSALLGYREELRAATQGRGELRMRLLRHEPIEKREP